MKTKVFLILFGFFCFASASATVHQYLYDGGMTAAENGTALQAAIDAASSGDEVKVQSGTYIGNFTMKEGVNVSGGWNSTFDAQTDYATILDANENGRVLNQAAAFSTLTIWSNLTIQNGKLTAALTDNLGAGVALNLKGQVKHCLIQNNTYTYSGNCVGGGVGEDATPLSNTEVMIDDCWIRNNKASHGGGVRIRGTIQNSIIENNQTSGNSGGGVHLQAGRMVGCIVRGNTSSNDCGGVRLYGKCDLINCLIYNNTASNAVGGVGLESALSNVIGNTIVKNNELLGTGSQAGVKVSNSLNANSTFFVNNVVWGNMSKGTVEDQQVYYISRYDKSAGQRSYNAIAGQLGDDSSTTSVLLSSSDPGFTDAANGDFSLTASSVLLDRGNSAKATVAKDLAGNDRVINSSVDIGAYEYPVVASDVYVLAGEDLQSKINNTAAGYTVYVEAGTYYGNFTMKDGVNVSGGWNNTFTEQTDYATILDAQESGRVLNQPANFTTLTVWSNLIIQNGKLTANLDTYGAGVFLRRKGQVKHCVIQDNTFTYTGSNCIGGGVSNNEVSANTDVLIDDCIIRRNTATHGGGVRIVGTIKNSIIEDNSTTNNAGGGVHLFNGGCMYNCIIRNNTAGTVSAASTGGIRMSGHPGGILANCLIAGNHATDRIGGLALELNSGATIFHQVYNNTFVDNTQASSTNPDWCGVRLNVGGPLSFCNNIVWGNKANDIEQASQIWVINSYSNQANNFVNNALVWNGKLSDGTDFEVPSTIFLTESPFADADYHLMPLSELINSGNNSKVSGTTDLDGNQRKQGNVDRGCYERTIYSRDVIDGNWGTICLPFAVANDAISGAEIFNVISFGSEEKKGIILDPATQMVAGQPYFFKANASTVKFGYVRAGDEATAGNHNGLIGNISQTTVTGDADNYVLQNNELRLVTGGDLTLSGNRAYLSYNDVPEFNPGISLAPGRRMLSIQGGHGSATGVDDVINGNPSSTKLIKDGQLLIIRDGKTYNALGQMIK